MIEPVKDALPARVNGSLDLTFCRESGQTRLRVVGQEPPLKVVRAFPQPGGGTLVHLHNLSGGVLGGDRLAVKVQVEPAAVVQLTTTSATRLYRSRSGLKEACQTTEIRVGEAGLLEYLPDPLIPFAGSFYRQTTTIDLAGGAGLMWWETVAPGREAMGEVFAYHSLETLLAITADGQPVALEHTRLEPARRPLTSPLRLGPYRYFGSFYICRVGVAPASWQALENRLNELATELSISGETLWGASQLPAEGLVVRAVSRHSRAIPTGLVEMWRISKQFVWGQEAILPRKTL